MVKLLAEKDKTHLAVNPWGVKLLAEKDMTPPQPFPRVKLLAEKDMTLKTPYH